MTMPFRVDNWRIDPSDNQAWHASSGVTRSLEPRLMRLLCALATSPRRVIDRDTLVDTVWPQVIVNENSLTRAVSDLRKALHTAEISGKQLIETVPKRGYRLMAEVEILSSQSASLAMETAVKISPVTDTTADPAPAASTTVKQRVHQAQASTHSQTVTPSQTTWHRWLPALAASLLLIITAVIQLPGRVLEPLAQSSGPEIDIQPARSAQKDIIVGQPLVPARNALAEQMPLPATNTFHWHGEVSNDFDNLNVMEEAPANTTAAVLAPEGDLLAYVEHSNNASRLMLRPTYNDAKPWTAFTTDETIMQLQWSPLGDGILFTLKGPAAAGSNEPGHHYRRLMLLDIQSLALHELYRKDDSPAANRNGSGNLT